MRQHRGFGGIAAALLESKPRAFEAGRPRRVANAGMDRRPVRHYMRIGYAIGHVNRYAFSPSGTQPGSGMGWGRIEPWR